ncbi:MAG: iron ABC transporter permease [Candidatus Delongbacteria bacterium]|nr:iron ABC transporter permease [Candidatus Delongbacteria bacterium]MBN2836050.1 iron ABC transporter permease [Candidatus Delongbacteria bacterium]
MPLSKKNRLWFILSLIILSIVVSVFSLGIGSADFNPFTAFSDILNGNSTTSSMIMLKIRLPRIILGYGIGGALSLAGVLLQGMFRNELAEPYTLGISGGASLGVAVVVAFGWKSILGSTILSIGGFTGALLTAVAVYLISSGKGKLQTSNMLLAGVMVSFISSSAVMLIMALSSSDDIQGIVFWIMGSLDTTNMNTSIAILIFSFVVLIVSFAFTRLLNALLIGEEEAFYLGFNITFYKKMIFITSSLLTGIAVSSAGIIGFVGLVIPHTMRFFVGKDHRFLLFSSFFAGAAFLVFSDTIARTIIAPLELPVGVITGIIGGTMFIVAIGKGGFKV